MHIECDEWLAADCADVSNIQYFAPKNWLSPIPTPKPNTIV